MGYPVITRLGLNQFWYRHWYSDINFKENLKQDNNFVSLIKFYLNYGLTFSNNIFFHEYFFNRNLKWVRLLNLNSNIRFFRKFYFSNELLGIEHSYFMRYKTGEYFPLRIWLIKYSNWWWLHCLGTAPTVLHCVCWLCCALRIVWTCACVVCYLISAW